MVSTSVVTGAGENESADDVFAAVPSRRSHIQSADPVAGVMVMREREALGLIRVDTDTDADVDGTGMATAQWRHILAHSPLVQGLYHATFPNHEDEGILDPDPRNPPALDLKDQALLLNPGSSAPDYGWMTPRSRSSRPGTSTLPVSANVLRKTEYISPDSSAPLPRPAAADMFVISSHDCDFFPLHILAERTSGTRQWTYRGEAQLASTENSFAAALSAEKLSSLWHLTKPRLRPVATYKVFPDAGECANVYDLFWFSERPGERGPEARFAFCDPCGIDSLQEEEEETEFHFVRDYKVVKVEQEVPDEFLLVFDDGNLTSSTTTNADRALPRQVGFGSCRACTAEERAEALVEVRNPMYLLHSADAEGEVDIDADGEGDADTDGEVVDSVGGDQDRAVDTLLAMGDPDHVSKQHAAANEQPSRVRHVIILLRFYPPPPHLPTYSLSIHPVKAEQTQLDEELCPNVMGPQHRHFLRTDHRPASE
ncbi:hypothetical protein F5888DRAFT_1803173 [Russula emetica]|nr:hypothetical protein F5888DRAFT_1803173 [Russula emetica]